MGTKSTVRISSPGSWLWTLSALSIAAVPFAVGCGDDDNGDDDDVIDEMPVVVVDAAITDGGAGMGGDGTGGGGGVTEPRPDGGDEDGAVVDECGPNNGGCDDLTTCTLAAAGFACGDCPDGYLGDGTSGCIPALISLETSAGTLVPEFSPAETEYALAVGLVTQRLVLTPTAPEAATIDINGDSVASGDGWASDVLDLGVTEIAITVSQPDRPDSVYMLSVTRSISSTLLKASNGEADDDLTSVAVSGDTLVVGAPGEDSSAVGVGGDESDDVAAESGAAYVFVRNGDNIWSQQAYLKASNTDAGDAFGSSVAISGDTLVVGAPDEASSATMVDGDATNNDAAGAGAAYVFVRDGDSWSPQAYLKANNAGANDGFGGYVAISEDTIVIGAEFEDSDAVDVDGDGSNGNAADSGAAYVFVRDGDSWSQQAFLKASNTDANDRFGEDVAISGDTVAVGARLEDSAAVGVGGNGDDETAERSGAVYVFARSGTTWSPEAYVKAPNAEESDEFGISLAISGDTLVVGASLEDSNATTVDGDQTDDSSLDAGAAYVYVRRGMTWSVQAYLKPSNTDPGDTFGWSIAVDGDAIVVGARLEDGSASGIDGVDDDAALDSGAAYLFLRQGNSWAQTAYLKAINTTAYDNFGQAVAISGETIAVTAPGEDGNYASDPDNNAANESGAVYVFR